MTNLKIQPGEFETLKKYIYDVSGIALASGKEYLVETRLKPLIAEYDCRSYQEIYTKAKADIKKIIERKIIDSISTNETYFFRDKAPFDLLQYKIIPDLIDIKTKKNGGLKPNIRIWSSASSTGQEIYSVSMILNELNIKHPTYNVKLLATDISDAAISQASRGLYNKFEVTRGLSKEKLDKYFVPDSEQWKIADQLRATVTFKQMNLMKPFVGLGKFDIIFCRNVAIYFTAENRARLFERLADTLENDGYLIIGSTESLTGESTIFEPKRYLNSTFYQKKNTRIV